MEGKNGNGGDVQQPASEVQPAGGNGGAAPPAARENNTLGIISMIVGILGILTVCCGYLSIFLGIVALILGIIAKGKNQRFAMAGIILGAVALVLAIIFLVALSVGLQQLEYLPDFLEDLILEYSY